MAEDTHPDGATCSSTGKHAARPRGAGTDTRPASHPINQPAHRGPSPAEARSVPALLPAWHPPMEIAVAFRESLFSPLVKYSTKSKNNRQLNVEIMTYGFQRALIVPLRSNIS